MSSVEKGSQSPHSHFPDPSAAVPVLACGVRKPMDAPTYKSAIRHSIHLTLVLCWLRLRCLLLVFFSGCSTNVSTKTLCKTTTYTICMYTSNTKWFSTNAYSNNHTNCGIKTKKTARRAWDHLGVSVLLRLCASIEKAGALCSRKGFTVAKLVSILTILCEILIRLIPVHFQTETFNNNFHHSSRLL